MEAFAEFIAESFRSGTELNWNSKTATYVTATFPIKSGLVEVSFEWQERDGAWHASFDTIRGEMTDRTIIAQAFRILNGLFQAVGEFLETHSPKTIVFSSKDDDLMSVYDSYLRRERAFFAEFGYVVEGPQQRGAEMEFTLRRVLPSWWRP